MGYNMHGYGVMAMQKSLLSLLDEVFYLLERLASVTQQWKYSFSGESLACGYRDHGEYPRDEVFRCPRHDILPW